MLELVVWQAKDEAAGTDDDDDFDKNSGDIPSMTFLALSGCSSAAPTLSCADEEIDDDFSINNSVGITAIGSIRNKMMRTDECII